MRKASVLALVIVLTLSVAGLGFAGQKPKKFKAKPFAFDPEGTGIITARWVTHQGLHDAGKSDHALYLKKDGPTATVAAAGAVITGVKGIRLNELGFDVINDGHCGAGAPRFNVTTIDGSLYFFGCSYGEHTPLDPPYANWTRVRFTDQDAYPQTPETPPWPGFGNAVIGSIVLIFDEGTDVGTGATVLDNIDINQKLIGKPGNAK